MNCIGGSELLAGKPTNETAAANFAARFQTPVNAQQIAPWNIDRFAIENFSEHDTVTLKKFLRDGFDFSTHASGVLNLRYGPHLSAGLHAGGVQTQAHDHPPPRFIHAVNRFPPPPATFKRATGCLT